MALSWNEIKTRAAAFVLEWKDETREKAESQLLQCCGLDWGAISPAIFGSMFQSVMAHEARRSLGAHYTSEQNILKLIGPLFMDDLWAEFERVKARKSCPELNRFHVQLGRLHFCDPACGCGNFLVVAYRELRLLEIEVIRALYRAELQQGLQVLNIADLLRVKVDQFFGIEIEAFPAQIAQVALWLIDHQMNLKVAEAFGTYFTRLPLSGAVQIRQGNALRLDWATCFGNDQPAFDYVLGNPPFVGKQFQSEEQKVDLRATLHRIRGAGVLDYVTAWYIKAAQYMQRYPLTRTAFVSTNSISQGEQVGILWNELFNTYEAKINFAHRTFQWTNEARGKAAVHVVIIGFALHEISGKRLFEHQDRRGELHERTVPNINPYLIEGGNIVVLKRRTPICEAPKIVFGSMPNDGGHLLLSPEEKRKLLASEPKAARFVRPLVGSEEFLNGLERWCLWLVGAAPHELRALPMVRARVEAVRNKRLKSARSTTRKLAATPTLFGEIRQPESEYLLIPSVSSENRPFIPIGCLTDEVIATNLALIIPGGTRYPFGVLSSTMHMTWVRYVGGRLKSDYRYSSQIIYNNYPWPEAPTQKQRATVESAAQAVLDVRQPHLDAGATPADLYDPLAMPPELVKAHHRLDRAVDRAYRRHPFPSETNRVAFLFERYETLTHALLTT